MSRLLSIYLSFVTLLATPKCHITTADEAPHPNKRTPTSRLTTMSSRTSRNHLAPDSPAQGPRASAPKGGRDALPITRSRYAMPATSGHDDDLPALQGQGDAPPASKGRYAMPATPGCEDNPANPSKRRLSLPPRKSSSVTISGSKLPVSELASTV